MDSSQAARIVGSAMTVSDKIRALDAAGCPRAEIARLLGKRYQHVRNVLEGDKARPVVSAPARAPAARPTLSQLEGAPAGHGVAEAAVPFGGVWRLQLESDGVVRLPAPVRAALGLKTGSVLICELVGDGFKILDPGAALERARSILKGLPSAEERSLVDELIAERRAEVVREDLDD